MNHDEFLHSWLRESITSVIKDTIKIDPNAGDWDHEKHIETNGETLMESLVESIAVLARIFAVMPTLKNKNDV